MKDEEIDGCIVSGSKSNDVFYLLGEYHSVENCQNRIARRTERPRT